MLIFGVEQGSLQKDKTITNHSKVFVKSEWSLKVKLSKS
jgi:hypothetical protein